MITAIILVVLLGVGIYLCTTWDYELLGIFMSVGFGLWLIGHGICLMLVSYNYETFMVERNAFEQTLHESRENGNEYETAAIVKEVAEWNQKLALEQYNNTTLYLNQFIDDRIELVEPIK
jgi:hypothetical protein